jgi:alpha-D-ribose 1-methylphosphonate 5-triphosphate synthase subunit PhnG
MKKILLAFFMLSTAVLVAQSTDLDPQEYNYSYVKLPAKPILDKKNRTYSFFVNMEGYMQYNQSKFFVQNQVNISGFEKKEKNGYLSIEVNLITPVITSRSISTRTDSSKDRNGVVRNTYYYTSVNTYTQSGSAKIVSSDGKINDLINFNATKNQNSTEFNSYSQAESYQYGVSRIINSNYSQEVINRLNNVLNNDYGYQIMQGKDKFWILANKKHPEQAAHYDAYVQASNVLNKINFAEPITGFETELKTPIDYFESLIKKYTEDAKADRKIRYSAYYNLAKIYKYLDNPNKSNEFAQKLIDNGYDESDGKNMLKDNNESIALFKANNTLTTHFPVETKNYVFEEAKPQYSNNSGSYSQSAPYSIETDPNYILAYILTIRKDTVTGYLPKSRGLNLSDAVMVSVKDMQGKFSERNFKANEVSKLILSNGEEFATVTFKVSTENGGIGMQGATKKFVKEMFAGKKIGIYQYFNGEVIIKRTDESEGKSNASAGWMLGAKKQFSELAAGCPSLLERVEKKEFKNNMESILAFAEALENCK